jgi:hypothetical protein
MHHELDLQFSTHPKLIFVIEKLRKYDPPFDREVYTVLNLDADDIYHWFVHRISNLVQSEYNIAYHVEF